VLLLTYPQDRPAVRLVFRAMNLWLRLSGCGFRAYVHRTARIAAIAEEHGLRLEQTKPRGRGWESAVYRRMPV
jgi:hypothetical protein